MLRLANWLNQNQGSVMAMLTFVYVITTVVIAALSVKATSLSKKHLETMVDLERNRLRPYVLFNIASSIDKRCTYASVKNHGLTAAYKIKVSIDPPLVHHHDEHSPLTHRDILLLPPDAEITDVIDSSPAFYQTYPNPIFEGVVEYEDINGKQHREAFRIDLTFLKKRVYIRDASIAVELKHLNETLTQIQRSLERKESLDPAETSIESLEPSHW